MSTAPDGDDRPPEAIDSPFGDPGAVGGGAPEPAPAIPVSESSFRQPPGSAPPTDQSPETGDLASRPEVLAGAAFAGGLAAAMIIRRALN